MTYGDFLRRYISGQRDFTGCDFGRTKFGGSVAILDCDFRGANFQLADFDGVRVERSNFARASLQNSRALHGCTFVQTQFDEIRWPRADIRDSYFVNCRFSGHMNGAVISRTQFQSCQFISLFLDGSVCTPVKFGGSVAFNVTLSRATLIDTDLDPWLDDFALRSKDSVALDWRSIATSARHPKLNRFLLEIGTPEIIAYYVVDAVTASATRLQRLMRSTFISYGAPDAAFARKLRDALYGNGVETFFFELDAIPGDRLHEVMYHGVNTYDRTILVCSSGSLSRSGVRN
jgi:hypothetical protein